MSFTRYVIVKDGKEQTQYKPVPKVWADVIKERMQEENPNAEIFLREVSH